MYNPGGGTTVALKRGLASAGKDWKYKVALAFERMPGGYYI
jgi:hypothetical protein